MANVDSPLGLRPIGNGKGGTAPQITRYVRSSTGVLYEGMALYWLAAGPANAAQTTMDPAVLGACAGHVGVNDTDVFVYDDPEQEFLIQGDSAVATPISQIGYLANPTNCTTANATTLQSKMELDTSALTLTRADGDIFQIVRPWRAPDNDEDAANAKWVVRIYPLSHKWASGVVAA